MSPSGRSDAARMFTKDTTVSEVVCDPVFGDFGWLLFPVDRPMDGAATLAEISSPSVYMWYSSIDADETVAVLNQLRRDAAAGQRVFYPIYTPQETAADPSKRDTGLFYFRGRPGAKFAVMNAGGGFVYVGAMHDSFPHARAVSAMGYNCFALIYRPDDPYRDLARALAFIHDHATELAVDPDGYSLWGGSAGARMAAALGRRDALAQFGVARVGQAAAVVTQYTGYTGTAPDDAPTYACVGSRDGIAAPQAMRRRLQRLESYGIPTEFHVYEGLTHGFGLGSGTAAAGWVRAAVSFWEAQMKERRRAA
jgi:esterase/lipase-like protein